MSVEKRRVAGRRRRARIARARPEAPIGQGEASVYLAAAFAVLILLGLCCLADDPITAFAVTLQAAAVPLISPQLLHPFGRMRYFNRSLSQIQANRRRDARLGVAAFSLMLGILVLRYLGVAGLDSNSSLIGALAVLSVLLCLLGVVAFSFVWTIDALFEGAAESWMQKALFGSKGRIEGRMALAGVFFFVGTLLFFWNAYF